VCSITFLERLVACSLQGGKYEDSSDFSTYEDVKLFFRGIDHGGGDTIDML